jgi:hypothetical protein
MSTRHLRELRQLIAVAEPKRHAAIPNVNPEKLINPDQVKAMARTQIEE